MPANVETMTHFGEVPWHGNSTPMTDAEVYDLDACQARGGLNWEAEKIQLCTSDNQKLVGAYAIRRKSDGKILGDSVGPRYTILQNKDAFAWFKPFVEAKEAQLHTAGSLAEGSRIWVLAKLNRDPMEIVAGDEVQKFILLSHSHDGSLAVRVGFTPIRVVCANTLAMAHNDDASKLIRVKHSKEVKTNLDNIRAVMNLANEQFEATAEQYRLLARKTIHAGDLEKFVRLVFKDLLKEDKDDQPIKDVLAVPKEKIKTRTRNIMDRVIELTETGKGNNVSNVRGTYWAAYNGLTQYLAWDKGLTEDGKGKLTAERVKEKADNRLNNLWYGSDANLNRLALNTAMELALAV